MCSDWRFENHTDGAVVRHQVLGSIPSLTEFGARENSLVTDEGVEVVELEVGTDVVRAVFGLYSSTTAWDRK